MYLSEINIYPVKSLGGISVEESVVEARGLERDRRLMLVDAANQFISQREIAAMALIKTEIIDDGLIAACYGKSLRIPAIPDGTTATVKVWSSSVKARVYDDETNAWFSDVLGINCRLVLMPEETKRKVNPLYAVRKNEDTVSFADGYPFLLIGQASLDDLNSRLAEPLPMNRFRPNFVVADAEPFDEDTWKKVRIGDTVFHIVKPCARCVITTVDQTTGEKGKEPLKTLASFRNMGGNLMFGQNLIAEKAGGTLRVGDRVEILKSK